MSGGTYRSKRSPVPDCPQPDPPLWENEEALRDRIEALQSERNALQAIIESQRGRIPTPLTPADRAAAKEWQSQMMALEQAMDDLREPLGWSPESPLPTAIYAIAGGYTRLLAKCLDWSDDVLSAWWLERNFGETPMKIGFRDEPLRSLTNLTELLDFIDEERAREAAKAEGAP